MSRRLPFLALVALYIVAIFPLFGRLDDFPAEDNFVFHLPVYIYFTQMLDHHGRFPAWYAWDGGMPVTATSMSLFPFTPHRLLAYAIDLIFRLEPLLSYKLNLWLGLILVTLGWYLVLRRLVGKALPAAIGVFAFLLSGAGVTIHHQEQILATMTFVPWLLLALLYVEEHPTLLILVPVIIGLGLTTHYPGIFSVGLVFLTILILSLGLSGRVVSLIKGYWAYLLLGLALGIPTLAPGFDLMAQASTLASPLRAMQSLDQVSFTDYLRLNTLQESSAYVEYLLNIFFSNASPQFLRDQYGFYFMTPFWLLILGGIGDITRRWPYFTTLLLLLWACTGIRLGFAQMLFQLHFPMIQHFRQWYHFFPYVMLCLSALTALGTRDLLQKKRFITSSFVAIVVVAAAVLARIQLVIPYKTLPGATSNLSRFSAEQFNRFAAGYGGSGPHTIFLYKANARLRESCANRFFPTDLVAPLSYQQAYPIWRQICQAGPRLLFLNTKGEVKLSSSESVRVFPDGLDWQPLTAGSRKGEVLLPMAHGLKAEVALQDQLGHRTYKPRPLFGGAFSAVAIDDNTQLITARLNVHRIFRAYHIQIAAVLLACIFCAVLTIRPGLRPPCRKLERSEND